jgi:hypothetical protein
MFTISQDYLSETIDLPILYLDTPNQEYDFEDVNIEASSALDSLAVSSTAVVASFTSGGSTYTFPLSGSDFTTQLTGTLTVRIAGTFSPGTYQYTLENTQTWYGRYGDGRYGAGRYGSATVETDAVRPVLQLQVLPDSWEPLAYSVSQVYSN